MTEETKNQRLIKAMVKKSLETRNELRVKYGQDPYDVDEFINSDPMTKFMYENSVAELDKHDEKRRDDK